MKRNAAIMNKCKAAYKKNSRKQFASLLLAEMPDDTRAELLTLIGE
jgi:uncharacterized tellurite resistance protein B-like protein